MVSICKGPRHNSRERKEMTKKKNIVNIKTWKETACNNCPLRLGCSHIDWWLDEGENFPTRCLNTLISELKFVIQHLSEVEKQLDKLKEIFEIFKGVFKDVFLEEEYW